MSRLQKQRPRGLDNIILRADQSVWKNLDCLDCGNCCKTMSPTYTNADISRIARHLGMTVSAFKHNWLERHSNGDWLNRQVPCQFFDQTTNKCNIYEVRPKDCAGFPHHNKKNMVDYMHVYKQNIEYCPATFRVVEKMMSEMRSGNLKLDRD